MNVELEVKQEQEQGEDKSLNNVDIVNHEQVAKEQQKRQPVKPKRLAMKIAAVFATCVQALIIVLLLCGAVQYYRHGITIVYAVKLLIKLFTISRAIVYRTLFGVMASAIYFVVLAFLIKWLVVSIKRCIHIVAKKDGNDCDIFGASSVIYNNSLNSFRFLIVLIVAVGLISPCNITGATIAIFVLVGVIFISRGIFSVLCDDKVPSKPASLLLRVAKDILVFVALCLVIAILNNHVFKDLIYGLQKMLNGNVFTNEGGGEALVYALYTDIVEPSLCIAVTIIFLVILDEILQPTVAYHFLTKSRVITAIVLTSILIASHLIFRVLVISASSFETYMIGEWLRAVSKTYLPLLLLFVTWHISLTALRYSANKNAIM